MITNPAEININKAIHYANECIGQFQESRYYECIASYKMAVGLFPELTRENFKEWSMLLLKLGQQFKEMSDLDTASYCLDQAVLVNPEWPAAHHARATIIKSPLEFNSPDGINRFFGNPKILEVYLSDDRIKFYSDFLHMCARAGIDWNEKDIADVGCGPGMLLRMISERSYPASMTGLDISEEALKTARVLCPPGQFQLFDLFNDTSDRTFDVVISTETLEHLLYPGKAIRKLLSLTKPMGHLILSVPNGRIDCFEGHINFWSPESWEVFIEENCGERLFDAFPLGRNNIAVIRKNNHTTLPGI